MKDNWNQLKAVIIALVHYKFTKLSMKKDKTIMVTVPVNYNLTFM